jgi:hypothetical protein
MTAGSALGLDMHDSVLAEQHNSCTYEADTVGWQLLLIGCKQQVDVESVELMCE